MLVASYMHSAYDLTSVGTEQFRASSSMNVANEVMVSRKEVPLRYARRGNESASKGVPECLGAGDSAPSR